MIKFDTLDQMVEAYQKQYNANYNNQPEKCFSIQDVLDVCVCPLIPIFARAKGVQISKRTQQIENFGYVQI